MPIVLPPTLDPLEDRHGAVFAEKLPKRDGDTVALPDLTYVFIVFTNRSGSTYLGELLAATGYFNASDEWLNHPAVTDGCAARGLDSLAQYFAAVAAEHARNGHFVLKASIGQIAVLAHHDVLARIVDRARFIFVERTDKVAQAISWLIAAHTGRYTSYQSGNDVPPPDYDARRILRQVQSLVERHAEMALFANLNGIVPLQLTYETLTAHPLPVGRLVCDYLGQPGLAIDLGRIGLQKQTTQLNADWRARFLAAPPPLPPRLAPVMLRGDVAVRAYRRATLAELADDATLLVGGRPAVERAPWLPPALLDEPRLAFGDTDVPEAAGGAIEVGALSAYVLRDAVVHRKYGILTVGDRVVAETLAHLPLHAIPGAAWDGERVLRLPEYPRGASLPAAMHLLASNLDNYYHWLMDLVSRWNATAFHGMGVGVEGAGTPVLLTPVLDLPWKWQSLDLAVADTVPRVTLWTDANMIVQRLLYLPAPKLGLSPHHSVLATFDRMRAAAYGGATPPDRAPWRRIYVSRADSQNRVLDNEAAIIEQVGRAGFEPVLLSALSVAEQVRLFAEASHVIAPHGAGLTNLAFCRPGAMVCELQMDGHLRWAFRRIAALRRLRYGCLVGAVVGPRDDRPARNRWRLDPARLASLLADARFAAA